MFWNFKILISNFLKDFEVLSRAMGILFSDTFYIWRTVWDALKQLGGRLAQNCGGFFHQIKASHAANRNKVFHTNCPPQESGDDIGFCIKQLKTLHFLIKKKSSSDLILFTYSG
jgi:hypothetical protein